MLGADGVDGGVPYPEDLPPGLRDVGVGERLGGKLPLQLEFVDADGRKTTLGECFQGGKPVILSLNYFTCPMLCNLQMEGLVKGMRDISLKLGADYKVVTVSIDPRDGPERGRAFEERYLKQYDRPVDQERGWHFLTSAEASGASVRLLAEAVGYKYKWVEQQKEFAHQAVAMVCSPDGKICRYLYGIEFQPATLRLSLVESSQGKLQTTLDRIILFCLHYDGVKGRYGVVPLRVMEVLIGSVGLVLAVVLGALWRRDLAAFGRTLLSRGR